MRGTGPTRSVNLLLALHGAGTVYRGKTQPEHRHTYLADIFAVCALRVWALCRGWVCELCVCLVSAVWVGAVCVVGVCMWVVCLFVFGVWGSCAIDLKVSMETFEIWHFGNEISPEISG